MSSEDSWRVAIWEGNRRRQHEEFCALSLREKIALLEEMGEIAARFDARGPGGSPASPSSTGEESSSAAE